MNWAQLRDSLMPLLLPLAILAASWMVQGIVLTRPKEQKEIGKTLLRGSKWFWGATIVVLILIEVSSQLAIYIK
jgi:hypothetical protein